MILPMDSTTIDSEGALLECALVPWDSEIFGFPVARIDRIEVPDGASPGGILRAFNDWCAGRDVRLVSCRIGHDKLRESMALEGHGFRFVEMVYGPLLESFDGIEEPRHAIDVSEAGQRDLEAIEEIAHEAFSTGRFLLDWRLDPELGRRRYANWVRTSLGSSSQVVLKAVTADGLVGFFIVEHRPDRSVYWHLTAVAPRWQGRGLGLSLWQTMLQRHRAEGVSSVATTISGHNIAALNLYARLGFSMASSQMTFHRLAEDEH
jgi:ribosomal protein S18 acetylase RimI-like enzyme